MQGFDIGGEQPGRFTTEGYPGQIEDAVASGRVGVQVQKPVLRRFLLKTRTVCFNSEQQVAAHDILNA